jgi:hypothetical protein
MAWYSQVVYEQQAFKWRVLGPYWWSYWILFFITFLMPQILWIRKFRKSYRVSFLLAALLSVEFIYERVIIVILTSYYRDYLPSSWSYYTPGIFEMILPFFVFVFVLTSLYLIFRKKLEISSF